MTTGVDSGAAFTGNAGDDVFNAAILTWAATDVLNGGAGTDTLNATINSSLAATTSVTAIELMNVSSLGNNSIALDAMTGVTSVTSSNSTGTLTLTAMSDSAITLGFAGSTTNNINATYTSDALSGSTDTLTVNLASADAVTATVNSGFETAAIAVTGTGSDLTLLTAPGVTAVTISGTGDLALADNSLAGFTSVTITDTAAISTGGMTGIKTFVATANTGGIVDADVSTVTGLATNTISGDTAGITFLSGAGADNVSITDNATSNSSTIKLGAGNDTLALLNVGAGTPATYVFGEAGNDTIYISDSTTAIAATDLFDGGEGTDTLVVAEGAANTFVLRGIENLKLTNTAILANTINSSDTALAITAQVGTGATDTAVNLVTLTAGSTVTTEAATAAYGTAATTGQAAAVTVGFLATEAASTINLATGLTGALTLGKITAATITVGAASTMTAAAITATDTTTDLTINATGAYTQTTGNIVGNTIKNVTVTGTAGVVFDDITSTALETVSVTAAGALDVGLTTAAGASLASVELTATGTSGSITSANIGSATATSLTVTETAATTVSNGAIDALDIAAITITGTAGLVDVGAITAADDIVGTIALTATNGELQVGTITAADEAGTITLTSTAGAIDGTTAQVAVVAADGVTVNMTAATFIDAAGTGTGLIGVANTAGDITASLSGAAIAIVDYSVAGTVNAASVSLNASALTGGLTSSITNDELSGVGTSTVTLGAATAAKVNSITFLGYTGAVSATGSIGADTFVDGSIGVAAAVDVVNSSDIFVGSTGSDTMSYAGHLATDSGTLAANEATSNGIAVNLSSSTITFYTGTDTTTVNTVAGTSTLATGKAAQYDSGATGASTAELAILAGGEIDTLSGFESVVGTAKNDYIVLGNTGMTATGGAGVDTIIGGAGNDSIKIVATNAGNSDVMDGGTGSNTLILEAAAGINTFATDADLVRIQTITNNSTGTLTLTGQTEAFAINGGAAINTVVVGTGTTTYTGGLTATDVVSASTGVASTIITGDATALTVTGSTVVDTFTNTGGGAISFTGGLGVDLYTGNAGAADTIIMTTGGAIAVDQITTFTTAEDFVNVDLSDLNALVGTMKLADNSGDLIVDLTPIAVLTDLAVGGDYGAAASQIVSIASGTAYTESTLATAIAAGTSGGMTAGDAFLVLYDNQVDSFLAYVTMGTTVLNGAAVGANTVTNILQYTGLADNGDLVVADFSIIT